MRWLLLLVFLATPAQAQIVGVHDKFDEAFRKYSKRFFGPAFDWQYFKAQGMAESRLRADARSHVGARGVMQVMPRTYRELKLKNRELGSRMDNPDFNIAAGIMYDRKVWEQWDTIGVHDEHVRFMMASYNAGPGNIRRASRAAAAARMNPHQWRSIEVVAPQVKKWRSKETIGYVRKIDNFYRQLNGLEDLHITEAVDPKAARMRMRASGLL